MAAGVAKILARTPQILLCKPATYDRWDRRVVELAAFRQEHGHVNVPEVGSRYPHETNHETHADVMDDCLPWKIMKGLWCQEEPLLTAGLSGKSRARNVGEAPETEPCPGKPKHRTSKRKPSLPAALIFQWLIHMLTAQSPDRQPGLGSHGFLVW